MPNFQCSLRGLFSVLAIVLMCCAALPAVGLAATITVTTTTDPVSPVCPSTTICSLRGAVAAAGNGDVVMLRTGTYNVTQSQILIKTGITIQGTGSGTTIIDASGSTPSTTSRAFKITGASQLSVTFDGLAITGATLNDTGALSGGAGIKNNSRAALLLKHVRIHGNTANVDAYVAVGGPPNDYANPNDPSEAGGGGVWSTESVVLVDSSVDHNTTVVTNSGVDSGGGGIFISNTYHGNLLLQDSTVTNNTATITSDIATTEMVLTSRTGGGGVYVAGNDLQLINSTIADNVATVLNSWGESGGGGAYVTTGDVTATNSAITGNSANVFESLDTTYLKTGNHGGGGIYQDGHDIDLVNTSISGNATTVTEASDLTTCAPTYSTPWCVTNGGGGIYQYGNRLTITGSTLSSNTATVPTTARSGGGGLLDNGNSSYITNTTITGNTAVVGLPVGFPTDGSHDNGINEANGGGGILYITVRDGITLANNTIAGNAAPAATGGGVLGYRNPNLDGITQIFVSNTIIATNTSSVAGTANCDTTVSGSGDPGDPITPDAVFTSLGYNLTSDASCNFAATGDLIANPNLGVLQNHGGPTATMALSAASPAVNTGNPTGCTTAFGGDLVTDQRGVVRPQPAGGRCDIGSYELAPAIATTDKATVVHSTAATLNGTANNPDALGGTTYFQYGTSAKYGKQTDSVTLGAATSATESATLTKLMPGTYHFRVVTVNAVGTAYGADQVFTTKQAVPPRLSISARTTTSTRTTYTFRVTGKLSASTTIPAVKRCTGSVVVRATQHGRFVQTRTVKLKSNCTYAAVFTIPSQRLTTSGAVRFRAQLKGNTAVGKRRSGTTSVQYGQTSAVTG